MVFVQEQHVSDTIPDIELTNCDDEPIHIPGGIQPHGVLLVISKDLSILQVSENVLQLLARDPLELLGQPVVELVAPHVRELFSSELLTKDVHYDSPLRLPIMVRGQEVFFDGLVSRSRGLTLLELENPSIPTPLPSNPLSP